MERPIITALELEERTVPDPESVAAIVAMAMRMRSRTKPKRVYAIPIDAGVTSGQALRDADNDAPPDTTVITAAAPRHSPTVSPSSLSSPDSGHPPHQDQPQSLHVRRQLHGGPGRATRSVSDMKTTPRAATMNDSGDSPTSSDGFAFSRRARRTKAHTVLRRGLV